MKTRKPAISISLLVITTGIAWLLNTLNIIPGVDWIWVTTLGISGILLLTLSRLDRFNFVVGVGLLVCSILSVLRQTGKLTINIEAPLLFITVGILLFLSQILPLGPQPENKNQKSEPPSNPPTP